MKSILRKMYSSIYREYARVSAHMFRFISGLPVDKYSVIQPNLVLSGQYKFRSLVKMKQIGIGAIVSMRETRSLPPALIHKHKLDYLHLPTKDQHAPSLDDLKVGVNFITNNIEAGNKVYVHCRQGEGRGPTMAAAYLISRGMSVSDALDKIRDIRIFIKPTTSQIEVLEKFEKAHETIQS